ncbi:hypothetical protein BV25DRAFT_1027420 [Artomyces pyxidatus]|uniref:Uncharacterized protein n=1 Tax=Artomyces pyxidatus TaxID=48021 RepID=A0ACB8SVD8_9AGAM|nr:hypothetical protein BV25DRAFT_1027420 [Artomyces pyxidatus]
MFPGTRFHYMQAADNDTASVNMGVTVPAIKRSMDLSPPESLGSRASYLLPPSLPALVLPATFNPRPLPEIPPSLYRGLTERAWTLSMSGERPCRAGVHCILRAWHSGWAMHRACADRARSLSGTVPMPRGACRRRGNRPTRLPSLSERTLSRTRPA